MRKFLPAAVVFSVLFPVGAVAQDRDNDWDKSQFKHVLLISIDGMHAVDFVAPTVLRALGLNPSLLDGIRLEGTGVLPDVNLDVDKH